MNVAGSIARLATGTYRVQRFTGSFVEGRWMPGVPTLFTIRASIQPATGRDLQRLPEGERTREVIAVFTPTRLAPGGEQSGATPDRVAYGSELYEVQTVEAWDEAGGYFKALAAKVPR